MIQAVIFDLGGVLVRTEDRAGRQKLEARHGLAERELDRLVFDSEPAVRATRGEVPDKVVWEHVRTQLKLDPAQLESFQRDFWGGDKLDLELVALLKSLRPHYKTAILSNGWSNARETLTHAWNLDQAVDAIIISAEEGLAKPDARLYQLAAARLGVPPQAAVLVDDFEPNIAGARAVGLSAIHYRPGLDVRAELRQLGLSV